jgi:hypothetical protein
MVESLVRTGSWRIRRRSVGWGATPLVVVALLTLFGCGGHKTVDLSFQAVNIGDCLATSATDNGTLIRGRVSCSEPHDAEVAAIVIGGSTADSYPGVTRLLAIGNLQCQPLVVAYVGPDRTAGMTARVAVPTEEQWRQHQNHIACFVRPANGGVATASLRHP